MAHCETVAEGVCACCGGRVAVKINRGGNAYYRCDNKGCGVEVRHHWKQSSDRYLRRFGAPAAGQGDDEGAANRREAPAAPAVKKTGGGLAAIFG